MPPFNLDAFLMATLDYLLATPAALLLLVVVACGLAIVLLDRARDIRESHAQMHELEREAFRDWQRRDEAVYRAIKFPTRGGTRGPR